MKNSSLLGITSTCKSSEFDCKAAGCTNPENKNCKVTCIPKFWVNNGREECADGSDEGTVGMKNYFCFGLHFLSTYCTLVTVKYFCLSWT